MKARLQVGMAVVIAMLSGGAVLADGPKGNAESGERVYRNNCLNCHGAKGQGDGPVADSLTPRPADLTSEMVQKKPEKELLRIILEGKPGAPMPAWKGDLSDQHIQDVLAYLSKPARRTTWRKPVGESAPRWKRGTPCHMRDFG
ncbi:MAG: cytochrome c [Nitrospirota bacterium]|nr:cytochrome c [Nitrospirota bacterium]